jgi:hypothetical protein
MGLSRQEVLMVKDLPIETKTTGSKSGSHHQGRLRLANHLMVRQERREKLGAVLSGWLSLVAFLRWVETWDLAIGSLMFPLLLINTKHMAVKLF